jgi:urease accessory protein
LEQNTNFDMHITNTPQHPMKRFLSPLIALTAGSAVVLGTHPALAHGTAAGGALDGLTHPLLGVDHLFMLMAAGTAASFISSQLLLWALGGAVIGAAVGFTGFTLASAEVLAALAISAVGALILLAGKVAKASNTDMLTTISGVVIAGGISIHAMLHGLEAPKDSSTLLWWSGALLSSVLVCGGTYLLQKKLPVTWTKAAAIAFLAIGGFLAFGPLGLMAGGAGA